MTPRCRRTVIWAILLAICYLLAACPSAPSSTTSQEQEPITGTLMADGGPLLLTLQNTGGDVEAQLAVVYVQLELVEGVTDPAFPEMSFIDVEGVIQFGEETLTSEIDHEGWPIQGEAETLEDGPAFRISIDGGLASVFPFFQCLPDPTDPAQKSVLCQAGTASLAMQVQIR